MSTGYLVPVGPLLQILTDQGVIGSGYKLNTYVGGSVSTPLTTYTDSTLGTPNSNPIVMGTNGRFQSVNIWVPAGTLTKIVLTDSTGTVITGGTVDNLQGINDISLYSGTINATLTGSYSGTVAATTLSASSTLSGAGFTSYFASPPAIGGTVPAAGAFTTLSASGNTTLSGTAVIGKRAYTTANSIAFSTTPSFDVSASNMHIMAAMTANVTAVTIANAQEGQFFTLRFTQDGAGSRTIATGNMGATNPPSISGTYATAPNKASYLNLTYNATSSRFEGAWLGTT